MEGLYLLKVYLDFFGFKSVDNDSDFKKNNFISNNLFK